MPAGHQQFVSMSPHDQAGAVLYVVSRSGKVLRNHEEHHHHRSRRFVDGDYFEGELEGWIFWESNKGNSSGRYDGDRGRRHQDTGGYNGGSTGFIGNALGSGRVTWSARIPFVEWGRESDSVEDFFSYVDWTQNGWPPGRKNSTTARRRHHAEVGGWQGASDKVFESPLVPLSLKTHDLFRPEWERWHRMERSYKIGLAQVAILRKADIGSRWEPGARELAARWAAWLLKMLRRTRSRLLQHLLFTMFSAVLPVICCSLVREQWTTAPDPELFRSVDIVWKALEKSYECFTPAQWEILQERLAVCRKMQTKLEGLSGRCSRGALPKDKLEGSLCRERLKSEMLNPPGRASQDAYQVCSNSRDEELSNVLLKSEGVSALVKRALLEKLSARQARHMDGNLLHGFSGGPGRIVSLVCPISKKRIKVPARGRDCKHLSSFDLDCFLEEHAKNDRQRPDSLHKQKKPKLEKVTWCCPICGADATWPQIVVDRVLLRILEVLPEHMPEVCLLPNGRWRVVWSPVGLDLGQKDAKLTTVALYIPFKSTLNDDIDGHGDSRDSRHDTFKAIDRSLGYQQSFGCHEVQILHRAYKAWKDGVDHHLSKESDAEQSKLQWGSKSTNAVWIDDHNSSRDMIGWPSSQQPIFIRERKNRVSGENSRSVNGTKVDSGIAVIKDVARISGPETIDSQIRAGEDETEIASTGKVILGASTAPDEMTSNCDGAQLRIGQHKSRPKQMAKKTKYVT